MNQQNESYEISTKRIAFVLVEIFVAIFLLIVNFTINKTEVAPGIGLKIQNLDFISPMVNRNVKDNIEHELGSVLLAQNNGAAIPLTGYQANKESVEEKDTESEKIITFIIETEKYGNYTTKIVLPKTDSEFYSLDDKFVFIEKLEASK